MSVEKTQKINAFHRDVALLETLGEYTIAWRPKKFGQYWSNSEAERVPISGSFEMNDTPLLSQCCMLADTDRLIKLWSYLS